MLFLPGLTETYSFLHGSLGFGFVCLLVFGFCFFT